MKFLILALVSIFVMKTAIAQDKAPKKKEKVVKGTTLQPSVEYFPQKIDRTLTPGSQVAEKIKVINTSTIEIEVELKTLTLRTTPSGSSILDKSLNQAKKKYKVINEPQSALSFMTIQQPVIKLKPKEVGTFTINFNIPKEAKGSYYFLYSVAPRVSEFSRLVKEQTTKLNFILKVNSPGVITVKGTEKADLDLTPKAKYLKKEKSLQVSSEVKNSGNSFLKEVTGFAIVRDVSANKVLAKMDLKSPLSTNNIVNGVSREYSGALNKTLNKGDYEIMVTFKDSDNKVIKTEKLHLRSTKG